MTHQATARHGSVRPELRVGLSAGVPGVIECAPLIDHRLTVHAGEPARICAACPAYRRGDIDIMPAGFAGVWVEEAPSLSLVLELSTALLRLTAEDIGLDPDRAGLEPRQQVRDPQIEHIAWALEAERQAGYPNGRLYVDGLATALAVHLLGRYAAASEAPHGLSNPQLGRVIDYVEAHLDQDLSLSRLARVAGVSASHLKTWFKRAMGVTVHRYVVQRRAERARILLLRGELSPTEIALEAGFAHPSHMAQWMRRLFGVTWRCIGPA